MTAPTSEGAGGGDLMARYYAATTQRERAAENAMDSYETDKRESFGLTGADKDPILNVVMSVRDKADAQLPRTARKETVRITEEGKWGDFTIKVTSTKAAKGEWRVPPIAIISDKSGKEVTSGWAVEPKGSNYNFSIVTMLGNVTLKGDNAANQEKAAAAWAAEQAKKKK